MNFNCEFNNEYFNCEVLINNEYFNCEVLIMNFNCDINEWIFQLWGIN